MSVSFARLFTVYLCSAMCKGAMVSQFSPDLIYLSFYSDGKQEFYDANSKTVNSIMALAPYLGQFTGSMALPWFKQKLTFRRTSVISLVCISVFYSVLLVPMPPYTVFLFIFLSGIFVSINAAIILMWIGELADKKVRGILGTIYELFCGIGQTVCSLMLLLIDYLYRVDGQHRNYYFLTFLPAILEAVLCAAFLRLIPKEEIATYNVAERNELQITSFYQDGVVIDYKYGTVVEIGFVRLLTDRTFLKAVFIAVLIGIWYQPSGINGVCQYATRIFATYFDSPLSSAYGYLIINGGKTIFTVPSIFLIERTGRKILMILGVTLCCLGLLMVVLSYTVGGSDMLLKVVLLGGLIIYLVGFELGPGPCNHVLNSEIYPRAAKGKLSCIQYILFYICNCSVVSLFEIMSPAGSEYIPYLCYFLCLICTTIPLVLLIPETKGKSNYEIEKGVLLADRAPETLVE